jgi:hypothetical protein
MKILVLSNLYPPNAVGGYERLCAMVADRLAQRGHRISVLTSDYGTVQPPPDQNVERTLKLLTGNTIYEPFTGTDAQREAIARHNLHQLEKKLAQEKPGVVLVGNLYFLHRSILGALPRARSVYLLTDVWRLGFEDNEWLGREMREILSGQAAPLVPPDPPALRIDVVVSKEEQRALDAAQARELSRRRVVEKELAAGKSAFQFPGICYLCGPTVFNGTLAGPDTLMMLERKSSQCKCSRCGLDGTARGALHAIDQLVSPGAAESILIVSDDALVRSTLAEKFPHCTVAAEVTGGPFRHAIFLDVRLDPAAARNLVLPGGAVLFGPTEAPSWPLIAKARAAELRDVAACTFWSRSYGYLARDHALHIARV